MGWQRDLDAARSLAGESGRPVLVLFQEVPGCQTCVDFGQRPLSHPLLVEAMETLFVPVLVYNNRPGGDAQLRKRYGEPAWNYPVMRFLDAGGQDILERRDGIWTTGGVAARLVEALEAAQRPVPPYLSLLAAEQQPGRPRQATFAMHCFWDGEARLGSIDGVIGTRAGWLRGREVVEVRYDEDVVAYADLVKAAQSLQCASRVYARTDEQERQAGELAGKLVTRSDEPVRDAQESDRKFALGRSELRYLPLTPLQATKVNAALRLDKDPRRWLSPGQVSLLERIRAALAEDPGALDTLRRPARTTELAAYQDELVELLGG